MRQMGANLTVDKVIWDDAGTYQCIAENIVGTRESNPFTTVVLGNFTELLNTNSTYSIDSNYELY